MDNNNDYTRYICIAIKRKIRVDNISQKFLAEKLNMSPKNLSAKLNLRRGLSSNEIGEISNQLWGDYFQLSVIAKKIKEDANITNEKKCH